MRKKTEANTVLFDTSALIGYFKEEKGGDEIEILLDKVENDEINGYVSVVTLTEIIFIIGLQDLRFAYYIASFIEESNLKIINLNYEKAKKAGNLKLKYPKLSTADAQIIISAIDLNIEKVVTKDRFWRNIEETKVIIV